MLNFIKGSAGLSLMVAVLLLGGCSPEPVLKDSLLVPDSLRGPFIRSMTTVHPGKLDEMNRYLPAVSVNTPAKKEEGEGDCSGVLISPRLVLTAGHCVCLRRKLSAEDQVKVRAAIGRTLKSQSPKVKDQVSKAVLQDADVIIDGSRCAPQVTVTVISYPAKPDAEASEGEDADLSYDGKVYKGQVVLPHDELMIVYSGRVTSFKEADLAIVVLNKAVKNSPRAVRLATAPVRRGDRVVMVGYGFGDAGKGAKTYGNRHFAESAVVALNGSDSLDVKFDVRELLRDGSVPAGIYGGDSGGPCFSKQDDGILVGIATAITSEDPMQKRSIFTSIYPHSEWVRKIAQELGEEVD